MLEGVDDLDATWIRTVDKLLTDGCESPLYNPDIHISELQATLYYLRGEKAWHRPGRWPSRPRQRPQIPNLASPALWEPVQKSQVREEAADGP